MKEPKQKAQSVKSPRKTAKSELKARLLATLKTVLDQDKIKLTKKIKKQSKKLLKVVADELVIAKVAIEKVVKPAKPAKAAPAAKAPKEVKTKPAIAAKAAPVKKAVAPAKAAVAKPAATKAKAEKK